MHFLPKELENYCAEHSSSESELLHSLYRETYQKVLQPRMLSGHYQGRLLSLISKMIAPDTILEIGTYTGYSALCLAEGLKHNGQLITIDKNEELEPIATKYFKLSPYKDQIRFIAGDARLVIPQLDIRPMLIFIDADKSSYLEYYELIIDKIPEGGIILADNVLWSGKVLEPVSDKDLDTQTLLEFNQKVANDPRVENILLPIRDGLNLIRKKMN